MHTIAAELPFNLLRTQAPQPVNTVIKLREQVTNIWRVLSSKQKRNCQR